MFRFIEKKQIHFEHFIQPMNALLIVIILFIIIEDLSLFEICNFIEEKTDSFSTF